MILHYNYIHALKYVLLVSSIILSFTHSRRKLWFNFNQGICFRKLLYLWIVYHKNVIIIPSNMTAHADWATAATEQVWSRPCPAWRAVKEQTLTQILITSIIIIWKAPGMLTTYLTAIHTWTFTLINLCVFCAFTSSGYIHIETGFVWFSVQGDYSISNTHM